MVFRLVANQDPEDASNDPDSFTQEDLIAAHHGLSTGRFSSSLRVSQIVLESAPRILLTVHLTLIAVFAGDFQIFSRMDADANNKITLAEWKNFLKTIHAEKGENAVP